MSEQPPAPVRYTMQPIPHGELVEVAPGILWLRLPLPLVLNHVNLWLLDEGDGWTLIDAGYGDDPSKAIWQTLLAGPLARKPIRRIVATHFHPDHMGLAGWLAERLEVPVIASRTEWLQARLLSLDTSEGFVAVGRAYDEAAGLDPADVAMRAERGNRYRHVVHPPPASFTRLAAGDTIELGGSDWQVIIGEGHSPEMLTFFSPARNILIAGDQVLPRISPVVAVWPPMPDEDPLAAFLRSLGQYLELPADCLVLPSHDAPFHGLHGRVQKLVGHHDERLEQTLAAAAEPVTLAEIMPRLFRRKLDSQQLGFAMGEALSHVNHLLRQGRLVEAGRRGRARLFAAA